MPAPTDAIETIQPKSGTRLSRRPLGAQEGADDVEMEVEAYIDSVEQELSVSKLDDIKVATKRDN